MLSEVFSTHRSAETGLSSSGRIPSEDADRASQATLSYTCSNCRVPACVDQGQARFTLFPTERPTSSTNRGRLGLSNLQHPAMATAQLEERPRRHCLRNPPAPQEGRSSCFTRFCLLNAFLPPIFAVLSWPGIFPESVSRRRKTIEALFTPQLIHTFYDRPHFVDFMKNGRS